MTEKEINKNIKEGINEDIRKDIKEDIRNEFKLYSDYKDRLGEHFSEETEPKVFKNPKLVILNEGLIKELKLSKEDIVRNIEVLSGSKIMEGSHPIAQAYGGFQFGYYTRLGDGRAALLGEIKIENEDGKEELYDLQLKGSGRTVFSRGGDGLASIGPMLREYIISEFMHKAHVSTTRSLSVFTTGESVYREKKEMGAVLARIAKSHIRFGTFQYISEAYGKDEVKKLLDYTIERHYSDLADKKDKYILFLSNLAARHAENIAKWMSLGFIHGVMNTDNMTLSGETIDYGPCAFMEEYDEDTVFSSIDRGGRYKYINQSEIMLWNFVKFTESIYDILIEESSLEEIQKVLLEFKDFYEYYYYREFDLKLGISKIKDEDRDLVDEFIQIMKDGRYDFTNSFSDLTRYTTDHFTEMNLENSDEKIERYEFSSDSIVKNDAFNLFFNKLISRLEGKESSFEIIETMRNHNPIIIPRNKVVEDVLIEASKENYEPFKKLIKLLENPYDYNKDIDEYYLIPMDGETKKNFRTFCGT